MKLLLMRPYCVMLAVDQQQRQHTLCTSQSTTSQGLEGLRLLWITKTG